MPYLYNAADVPWRTQEVLAELVAMYGPLRDGLPGNDDMGQMSAWLVWTMLGLYPGATELFTAIRMHDACVICCR